MKRSILVGILLALVPAVALAQAPSRLHARQYEQAYHAVAHKLGRRAPGRNIVRWGLPGHRTATDRQVLASLGVLRRMLAPPAQVNFPPGSPAYAPQATSTSTAPSSGLAACIISRESGGNPTASNGQYSGIAQWSPSSWAQGGGTQYAASPTGATYSQQVTVLNRMLAAGQAGQWTPYDHC